MNCWMVLTVVLIPIALCLKGNDDSPTEDKMLKEMKELNKSMNKITRR